MKKLWIFILILCSFLFACQEQEIIPVFEIIGEDKLEIGYSYEYSMKYEGEEIDLNDVYFIVSNPNICSVEGTTITALEYGVFTLTVAFKEDPTIIASKHIEIIPPLVTSIKIKGDKIMKEGEQILLEAIVTPDDTFIPVEWFSSDESIATVDEGIITALQGGTVIITAKCSSATAKHVITIDGIIRNITVEGDDEIKVNSSVEYKFNIDDPIITTDSTNIAVMGNIVYGIEVGKAVLHIVSESNPNLQLDYEINVVIGYNEDTGMTEDEQDEITSIMESLSLEQKIGQMMVLQLVGDNFYVNDELGLYYTITSNSSMPQYTYLKDEITIPVGNILVTNNNTSSKANLYSYIEGMQDIINDYASIGALVITDRSGFASTINLNGYTNKVNNLLFGTANDYDLLSTYYDNIGYEMYNTGINVVVQSSYLKSSLYSENFSNNELKNIIYSKIMNSALKNNKVNPGFYYDAFDVANQFENNEKLLQTAINDGLDFMMAYYTLNFASIKQESIPTYVRRQGYNGLVMPSFKDYELIVSNNNGLTVPTIEYLIEQGFDLIPITLYANAEGASNNVYANIAFETTVEKVINGEIDIQYVNAAVERILLYKMRHGLMDVTKPTNVTFKTANDKIQEAQERKKFISIQGEFDGLDVDKNIKVISIDRTVYGSNWRPTRYYFGSTFQQNKDKFGYNEVEYYVIYDDMYESYAYEIQEGDQVVIAIYSAIEDLYWYTFDWCQLINLIKEKTDDIVIVNLESPLNNETFAEYNYPIICANGKYDNTFKEILEVLKDGNCSGVI